MKVSAAASFQRSSQPQKTWLSLSVMISLWVAENYRITWLNSTHGLLKLGIWIIVLYFHTKTESSWTKLATILIYFCCSFKHGWKFDKNLLIQKKDWPGLHRISSPCLHADPSDSAATETNCTTLETINPFNLNLSTNVLQRRSRARSECGRLYLLSSRWMVQE